MRYIRFAAAFLLLLPPAGETEKPKQTSYTECRKCHSDIFRLWRSSRHAESYSNPTFFNAYLTVVLDNGRDRARLCLQCHAPIAYREGDFALRSTLATEGVNCVFCHTVESVRPGENIDTYYQPDGAGKIRGPYEPTLPSTHEAEYSPLFLQADLCAGCHEYENEYGVMILSTFSEWSESPYPGNDVHCQNCHMPIMPDLSVVDGRQVPNYYVTAHEFRGGHSNINLEHAVSLETTARRDDDRIEVLVSITNSESGHKLPTGIPIRKIVLDVALETDDGFTIGSAGKVYRKVLTDKYGTIIENAPDMFLNATAVFSDNRIRPKETRVEKFTFVLPKGVDDYRVKATLNYEHSRPVLKEEHVRIPMASNTVLARDIE